MRFLRAVALLLLSLAFTGCSRVQNPRPSPTSQAVATSHPLATGSAARILRTGGSAVDAAIAAAFVLNATEPWNSGLGGGGFALVWEPRSGNAISLDFRETAPSGLQPGALGSAAAESPNALTDGALSVAVPGQWAGLVELHRRFGKLPLTTLAADAVRIAADGFPVSAAYGNRCKIRQRVIADDVAARRIFLRPDGSCPDAGEPLVQKDLSRTISTLARDGRPSAWADIAATLMVGRLNPDGNPVSIADIASYAPVEREPVRGRFMDREIVSMGPPSSGGIIVISLLQTYEATIRMNPDTNRQLLWIEASRLAFFDRAKLLGDPDFVHIPLKTLLSMDYASRQARRISGESPLPLPDGEISPAEGTETTHISVIDGNGLAVAMTLSINTPFGSGVVIPGTGVLLNNHMDDFFVKAPNSFGLVGNHRNAPAPAKRPLSSMSPTFVLKNGRLVAALGSPGGSRIPTSIAWVIRDILENHSDGKSAVCAPRMHHQWRPDLLYMDEGFNPVLFEKSGYKITEPTFDIGNVQMVLKTPGGWKGYSDCRGDGAGWAQ